MKKPLYFLIQYDIKDKKRLAKVYRLLRKQAFAIQNSVFIWAGNQQKLTLLQAELKKIIKKTEDDIRAYQLHNPLLLFGTQPFLSDNIYFNGYPTHIECAHEWLENPPDLLWQSQMRNQPCNG